MIRSCAVLCRKNAMLTGMAERVPLRVGDREPRVDEVPVGHAAVAAAARAGVVEQEPARPARADHPPLRHLHEVRVLRRHRRGAQLALLLRRPAARAPGGSGAEEAASVTCGSRSAAAADPPGPASKTTPVTSGTSSRDRRGHDVLDRVGAAAAACEQHVHRAVVVDLAERDARAVRAEPAPRRRQRVVQPLGDAAPGAGRAAPAGPPPAGRPRAGAPSRRPPPARMTDTTCSRPAP